MLGIGNEGGGYTESFLAGFFLGGKQISESQCTFGLGLWVCHSKFFMPLNPPFRSPVKNDPFPGSSTQHRGKTAYESEVKL